MYDLIVCGVFKNESHILDEWIQHYLSRGFQHIYLVNDFSKDDYKSIINKYKETVTLYENDIITKDVGKQIQIYNKFFGPIIRNARWVGIFDLDEFVYSPTNHSILDVLESFKDAAEVKIDWLHFGSNGHIQQPKSVIEGFTRRAAYSRACPWYSHKCFFRPDKLQAFNIHFQHVNGPSHHLYYSETEPKMLVINHYSTQSREFYLQVKATRGDINNWFDHNNLQRNLQRFIDSDINDIEDTRLVEQNRRLKCSPV